MPVDWNIADPKQGFDYLQSLQAIGQAQAQRVQTQTNQYALRQRQRQDELRPAIAARLGQNDFAGAQQQAISVGDDELATRIGGLHDEHFGDLMRQNDARGNVAYTLAQIKDSAQRAQAYQAALPHLLATGITQQELSNPDLSDSALQQHIAEAQGLDAIIKQKQQEREAAQRDRGLDLTASGQALEARKFDYEQHKPVATAYGTSLIDPATGRVVYDGSGGLAGGGAAAGQYMGGWTPRARNGGDNSDAAVDGKIAGAAQFLGVAPNADISKLSPLQIAQAMTLSEGGKGSLADRNNNPGNLRNGDGSYKRFPTKEAGLQAAAALVARKLAAGQTTVQTMIEGLPKGGGAGGSGGAGGLGADAIDRMATDYNRTHKIPPGFTKNPAAVAAIQNRAAQQLREQGGNASTSLADTASVHADTAGLAALQRRATTMNASETAAQANAHLVLQLAPAVGNGNVPVFNAWKNAAGRNTGDPNISKLNAAVETFANEYATVMGKGVPTDGLRAHAHEMINTSQSPKQLQGVVSTLMKDMANQRAGFAQERQETLARIGRGGSGGGTVVHVTNAQDYARLASGTSYIDPNGNRRTKK